MSFIVCVYLPKAQMSRDMYHAPPTVFHAEILMKPVDLVSFPFFFGRSIQYRGFESIFCSCFKFVLLLMLVKEMF